MALPWFKFWVNDWLSDEALRSCSYAARGLWADMLSLAHKCDRRGYLQLREHPLTAQQIARMTGGSPAEVLPLLRELEDSGVLSVLEDGTYYSRRMVRDETKRQKCSQAGSKGGGNPKLSGQPATPNGTYKGDPKGHNKGPPKGRSGIWSLVSDLLPLEFKESAEFKKAWAEWEKYRRSKGKPISECAAKKQAKKIAKEFGSVQRAIAAIEHSIANDYQGLYEPSGPAGRNASQGSQQRGQDGGRQRRADKSARELVGDQGQPRQL